MRALVAGERTTIAGARVGHLPKVEITNGSGTWKDYSAYVVGLQMNEGIDQPVGSGAVRFRRAALLASLAPLMAASTLNVDDAAAYSPAIDLGRLIRINTATHTIGGALTYREVWMGRVDGVEWSQDPIEVPFSDLGGWLQDTQIEAERTYGSDAGVAAETVLQGIVTDNPDGGPAITLYTPTTPGWMLHTLTQSRAKVLEALRALAVDGIGWDVRYRYDALHASRLTLYDPDRDRVSVDATIPPTEYTDVRRLNLSLADVRNVGRVVWYDTAGVRQESVATDAGSLSKYRRRYFELTAPDAIDTGTEGDTLVAAIVNDLAGAPAEQEIVMPYFWPVQLYDRYTFTANGVHYDADQTLTVVGYSHSFENGEGVTTLTCTGRVVGSYATWLKKVQSVLPKDNEIKNLTRTDSADGDESTFSFTLGADVDSVWVGSLDITAPQQSSDWDLVAAAVAPLAPGVLDYTVTRPRDGHEVLIQFEPRDANLNAGTVRRAEITATPQVPHWLWDDHEDYATGIGTLWGEYTERGIVLTSITFQTQVGSNPISGFVAPTRVEGAVSVVKGGVLGPRQVEMDVTLDVDRQSWIVPHELLENGKERTPDGWFAFDRDKNPNLMGATVSGTKITVLGDVDTRSIKVDDLNSTWEYTIDGPFAVIDVALAGTNAVAGLGTSASSTYRVTGYSDRKADISGTTLVSVPRDVVVGGASSTPPAATIVDAIAVVPDVGNTNVRISIQVTSVIALWTVKVAIGESTDNSNEPPVSDFAAAMTPSAVTPTATMVEHVFSAANTRVLGGPDTLSVYFNIRIDLCDGSGAVMDTHTINTGWETPV